MNEINLGNFFEVVKIQEAPALLIADELTDELVNNAEQHGFIPCSSIEQARLNLILGNQVLLSTDEDISEVRRLISQMGRWNGSLQWFDEVEKRFIIKNCDTTQAKLVVSVKGGLLSREQRIFDDVSMVYRLLN
jgi:hypothetical protein